LRWRRRPILRPADDPGSRITCSCQRDGCPDWAWGGFHCSRHITR
jgi:hypothetical protein